MNRGDYGPEHRRYDSRADNLSPGVLEDDEPPYRPTRSGDMAFLVEA